MVSSAGPDPPRERCRGCGAEFKDLVCEYCGLASRKAEDPALERAALDEFHVLLRRCEPDAQAKLLREGFLPAREENLLEAAVLCLPYLAQDSVEPGPAAGQRLESILAKLSALTPSDNLQRAVAHYRERLAAYRRSERSSLVGGFVMFGLLAVALIALIFWFASLL
jgi:hypothetical protein